MYLKTDTGFTLIELMIVLVIAGLALSLVGPLTINQLDSMRRLQEQQSLTQSLSNLAFKARLQGNSYEVRMRGTQVDVWQVYNERQATELANYTFEFIHFPEQSILLNSNGFWEPQSFQVHQGGRVVELSLKNRGVIDD